MRRGSPLLVCMLTWLALVPSTSVSQQQPGEWASRIGAFLGPQYYLQHDQQVQFSFGAEGHLRAVGPLAVGVSLGMGVIADTTCTGLAGLRLHLVQFRKLSLGLDLRGGATFWLSGEDSRVEPQIQGGLELVHDLGESFLILLRAGIGWVPGEDRGALADLAVGLGFYL